MELEIPRYDLNHSRPIVGYGNFSYLKSDSACMVDTSIVEKKFKLWDYVMENNLLASEDKSIQIKVGNLLNDKTIFMYAFMKLNGKPVKARWTQDVVLCDTHDRILFCGANQVLGKSVCLDFDASTEFLRDHNQRWVGILISGSLTQSQDRMRSIKMLLDSMKLDYRLKDVDVDSRGQSNATQISIYFYDADGKPKYSNHLICCPHTSAALGYPADNIWLDEVDFWEDVRGGQIHFYNQVLDPRTYFTHGKIKGFSNPNGKERLMWHLWNLEDKNGKSVYHRYHFNYWDKTFPAQNEFEKRCVGKTRHEIESTLLAMFTSAEGSFFSTEEIKDMLDLELAEKGDQAGYGRETAWFLDVGSVHDQSVLGGVYLEENPDVPEIPLIKLFWIHKYPVGYPLARVVGIKEVDEDDGWHDEAEDNPSVKFVLDEYAEEIGGTKYRPLFGFDATGNAGMLPLFSAAGIDAVDITFTGKRKWHMYQRFQYYVQQRFLKRAKERDENTVRGCDFDYQASKLMVKKNTQTSYKQIHHENEDDLDDCMDMVAGGINLIENPDLPSLSFDIIKPNKVTGEDKEEVGEEENEKLKDQYIPGYVDKDELEDWISRREGNYH